MSAIMTDAEHRQRHIELHRALDELVADHIGQTGALPSQTTVLDLMRWAYDQTQHTTNPARCRTIQAHGDSDEPE